MVSGLTSSYPDTLRPALQVIGPAEGVRRVAGMNMIVTRDQFYFFADVTVNIQPSADELADIALLCAKAVRRFDVEPRIAMVSFSNFGGGRYPESEKMRLAAEIVRSRDPQLQIDGEVQADIAIDTESLRGEFPFCQLKEGANVLIFPCLSSSNAAYKLVTKLGAAESIGPILLGMKKPVHVLQYGGFNEVDVVNMTAIAVVDAQAGE
jgi:malate dehydrogenase (oxaloacetate-decarboxylating)(NADP+)